MLNMDQCLTAFFFSMHFIRLITFFLTSLCHWVIRTNSDISKSIFHCKLPKSCPHLLTKRALWTYRGWKKKPELIHIICCLYNRRKIISCKWIICQVNTNLFIYICFIYSQFGVYLKQKVSSSLLVLGMSIVLGRGWDRNRNMAYRETVQASNVSPPPTKNA